MYNNALVRRRVWRGRLFVTVCAVAIMSLGVPLVATAANNSANIVYQVSPIVRQANSSTSPAGLTPGSCVAAAGLACYSPQVLHTAYGVPWSINGQLAGSGTQIAIIDAFGSPTVSSDLATFDAAFGLPPADLHVYYPTGQPSFSGGASHLGNMLGWAEETSLDVQTAHDLAPGARINLIVASSPDGNVLNNAVKFALNHHLGDVLSMSYGAPEGAIAGGGNNLQIQQAHALFQQAVANGVSVFASSGDSGATNGLSSANALYPASDPNVTSTGGTDLFVPADSSANSTDYNYASEYTWNDSDPSTCPFGCLNGVFGATGGANSAVFATPSYQQPLGLTTRATSDVSFNASVYTATLIYLGFLGEGNNGFYFFGGTSEASPSWAAITADLDQAHGGDLGAMNPVLYGLAASPSTYAADFHDVTSGNNQLPFPNAPGSPAGVGYDIPTGLGTPNVAGLMNSLESPGTTSSSSLP